MSIATVVTEGFGSFGDVAHIITQGFDIGSPPVINADATILTQAFGKQTAASSFVVTEGFRSGAAPTGQVQQPSGGYFERPSKRRTPEQLRKARERLGILEAAAEVIDQVAFRQAEQPGLDSVQQTDELRGELAALGLPLESPYLDLLQRLRADYEAKRQKEAAARAAEELDIVFVMAMLSEIDDLH